MFGTHVVHLGTPSYSFDQIQLWDNLALEGRD